jgi:Uma2 family endonuclease
MVTEMRQTTPDTVAENSRVWRYADLLEMPEDPSRRYEILEGELFVSPSPSINHLLVVTELHGRLLRHVDDRKLGLVSASPADVKRSEYAVVVPDIFFIRQARMRIIRRGEQTILEPPDLAVEVVSPASVHRDRARKFVFYAEFGVPEYWIVDPLQRTFDALRLQDGSYEPLPVEHGVFRSEVVEGFELHIADLFRVLDEDDDATTPSTTGRTAPSAE